MVVRKTPGCSIARASYRYTPVSSAYVGGYGTGFLQPPHNYMVMLGALITNCVGWVIL